jgi:nitrous oxide reductase accessory protein NosL
MNKMNVLFALVFTAVAGTVFAADEKPAVPKKVSQQEKMKYCSKDAKEKGMKGDERKSFMSTCLKKS